jgi:hypothetical protein
MSGSKIAAWNPSNNHEFATYGNQLELWGVTQDTKSQRSARSISTSKLASNLTCMDWQPVVDGSMLAYGTASGSVGLVRWSQASNMEVKCFAISVLESEQGAILLCLSYFAAQHRLISMLMWIKRSRYMAAR